MRRWLSLPIAAAVTAALLVAVPVVGDSASPVGSGAPLAPAAADTANPDDFDPVPEGNYVPLPQALLVDTRSGTGAPQARLSAGATLDVQVTGRGGVPSSNVAGLALDITTVNSAGNTPLTVWPTGTSRPPVTSHTAMAGETLSNLAFVAPGSNGRVSVYTQGQTDLLVWVTGYFTADESGAGFSVVNQARVANTQNGTGVRQGVIASNDGVTVSLTGAGVPTTATSAAVTLVMLANTNGFVNAGIPNDSSGKNGVPYAPGRNAVTKVVPIKDGQLQVINGGAQGIDLLVDVQGYFGAGDSGGGFTTLPGARIYDSRTTSDGKLGANSERKIQILGQGGIDKRRVGAAMLSLTVTGQSADGAIRVGADGLVPNPSTNLTYEVGQNRTNSLIVPMELPATGQIIVRNDGAAPIDVVIDSDGWFAPYFNPVLSNQYPAGPGEREFSVYTDAALNDRTTAGVNSVNGNLLVSVGEINIAGRGANLNLGRHYNSRTDAGLRDSIEMGRVSSGTAERGAFGPGWTLDATGDIRLAASGNNRVFHGPTGTEVTFTPRAGGGWNPPTGMTATLRSLSGGFELRIGRTAELWNFTTDGRLTSRVDRNGNTISYSTDANGRLSRITDTRGRDLVFTWATPSGAAAPVVTQITDAAGSRQWSYAYTNGRLTTATNPANQAVTYTYNSAGQLATIADFRGVLTVMTYDVHGRVTKLERPLTGSSGGPTTNFDYADGRTRVVDARGHTTTYVYDYLGRVSDVWDALKQDRSTDYDLNSNIIAYTPTSGQAAGASVVNTYSATNNLTRTQLPTGSFSTATYDDNGTNPYAPIRVTNGEGGSKTYTYDSRGNQASVTDSATDAATSRVERNPDGQISASYDAKGIVTRYSYNSLGELTAIDHPAPLGDETFTYDALSRLATAVDGKGVTTRYAYDALDRVTSTTTGTGSVNYVTNFYDAAGNRLREVDDAGDDFSTYDRHNRVLTELRAVGGEQRYTYDEVGNLTRLTSSTPGASTTTPLAWTHEFNEVNLVEATTNPAGSRVTYAYNQDNQRTRTAFPGGTVQDATWDAAGRVSRIRATNGATVLADNSYAYTKAAGADTSLVSSRVDHVGFGAPAGSKTSYTYDARQRLVKAEERTTGGSVNASWEYGYDKNSNRVRQVATGSVGTGGALGTTTYGYNDADQLVALNGSATGWSYDANGNEASGGAARPGVPARSNEYSRLDQTSATTATGTRTAFSYSGATGDQRLRAAGTTFTQSTVGTIGTSTTSGGNSYVTRDPAGSLVSTTTNGVTQYFLTDNLGSVIALVDGAGVRTAAYSYDPYGATRSVAGTAATANPYRYTGAYLDGHSGLYKMGARYYDPSIGRFTQTDPARQEANNYLYANANPVNYVDTTGTSAYAINLAVELYDAWQDAGTLSAAVDAVWAGDEDELYRILWKELFSVGVESACNLIAGALTSGVAALLVSPFCSLAAGFISDEVFGE